MNASPGSREGLIYFCDYLLTEFSGLFSQLYFYLNHWCSPQMQAKVAEWAASPEAESDWDRWQVEWDEYLKCDSPKGYHADLVEAINKVCPEIGSILKTGVRRDESE